ncbi:hypothetical protein Pcinc_030611 [Petrolisthes cinctipes]|uniref:DUF7064 domain-containing protein n=1 Tax=Petrolisthes cinctipes TaxID=88211 RepID=A0AAE1K5T8_PETCI|nr:hypothetical protein Pcinc_030611 [Petrolisthes cinctipes]
MLPPPRILGVYSRPGFWFPVKLVFFYFLLRLRRLMGSSGGGEGTEEKEGEEKLVVGATAGYGVKSKPTVKMMECVQQLSEHPKAIDAVYFNAANSSGHYLVAATARRPQGVINGLLFIRIPNVGILQLPRMPDTLMFGDGDQFGAEGLRITPVTPMVEWKIQYDGTMKLQGSPLSQHQVELDVTFTSDQPYFDFDTDMDAWTLARSVALEPWSPQYFHNLKLAHQTHYEQMGRLEGTVVVDGRPHVLRLDSMRDHSYGHKREWKLMHRYGLHMFTTEDGIQGNVGVICQPATCSRLEMGYIYREGQMEPVTGVDLTLWQHGENGHPPNDYAFSFTAGGKQYMVEVSVLEAPEFYIGWEWETRVVERMATFRVNGEKGWGLAEWDYRHHGGRPHIYTSHDPAWTVDLVKG